MICLRLLPQGLALRGAALLGLVAVCAVSQPSQACEYLGPGGTSPHNWDWSIDESLDDEVPPEAVEVEAEITFVEAYDPMGGPCVGTSCAVEEHTLANIRVSGGGEELDDLGLEFELVEGEIPERMPGVAWLVEQGPVNLWTHDFDYAGPPGVYSFTLSVTPVDRAGNAGPSTEVVFISDGGRGCSIQGKHEGALGLALGLGLLGLGVMRRSLRRPDTAPN